MMMSMKDKNRPKNPMSAYACFIQVIREEHRRKHPNEHVDFSEFSKKCAEKWRTMTQNEKKRFEDMAEADRLRFNREMAQYIPPQGMRGKKRKMPKDPTKPKRAWSAFFFFCDEYRPQVREQHPEWRVGGVAKELGKMWEACTDKTKYENMAQEARQKYEEEMAQYRAGTFVPTQQPPGNNGQGSSGMFVQNTVMNNQTIQMTVQPTQAQLAGNQFSQQQYVVTAAPQQTIQVSGQQQQQIQQHHVMMQQQPQQMSNNNMQQIHQVNPPVARMVAPTQQVQVSQQHIGNMSNVNTTSGGNPYGGGGGNVAMTLTQQPQNVSMSSTVAGSASVTQLATATPLNMTSSTNMGVSSAPTASTSSH